MTSKLKEFPTTIVIFGASGDLTQRKLIPSLFNLYCKDRMPKTFRVVGYGGTDFNDESFRSHLKEGMEKFSDAEYTGQEWKDFASHVVYVKRGYTLEDFNQLDRLLDEWQGEGGNRMFYMATPPDAFPSIIDLLGKSRQLKEERGWRRVVIEKPFGTDLDSARKLNRQIHKVLNENQIYRIDHYLGKETLQNILMSFIFSIPSQGAPRDRSWPPTEMVVPTTFTSVVKSRMGTPARRNRPASSSANHNGERSAFAPAQPAYAAGCRRCVSSAWWEGPCTS